MIAVEFRSFDFRALIDSLYAAYLNFVLHNPELILTWNPDDQDNIVPTTAVMSNPHSRHAALSDGITSPAVNEDTTCSIAAPPI